ncbi:MAG: phosphopantetheine-binding protein [Brachyspira sp.]|nr:phosphopantetheine-binding protein [Brachyspira sp.]
MLEDEIKELIIKSLELEDILPDDINEEEPLFIDGLGLDSIDALELGMALKKKYNLTLSSDKKENQKHFYSVKTLADFIRSNNVD